MAGGLTEVSLVLLHHVAVLQLGLLHVGKMVDWSEKGREKGRRERRRGREEEGEKERERGREGEGERKRNLLLSEWSGMASG